MSRQALREQDVYTETKVDSTDWWGDFDLDVPPRKQRQKFKVYENPNYGGKPYHRPVQRRKASHPAMAFMALILFFTLSVFQITRLAALNEKGREIASLNNEIRAINKDTESKQFRLAVQENIERVRKVAIEDLGMIVPMEDQTIVIGKPQEDIFTNANTAGDIAGDGMEANGAP